MLPEPTAIAYIVAGLLALYRLPEFGRNVLAFLRDLDDYRAGR